MNVKLNTKAKRFVEKKVREGAFKKPEDVVHAALAAMGSQYKGDFAPGELAALIAEGEASIKKHGLLEASKVFAEFRNRKRQRKAS